LNGTGNRLSAQEKDQIDDGGDHHDACHAGDPQSQILDLAGELDLLSQTREVAELASSE